MYKSDELKKAEVKRKERIAVIIPARNRGKIFRVYTFFKLEQHLKT